ncbi:MAG: hypothetical protein EBR51_06680 [Gammaproteobacteria bacterium]|nr:hypothetical protein [Gammaproteobacteria bacterium]
MVATQIREEIESAEMARKQAKDALEQYQQSLAQARAEAQKMLETTKAQQTALAAELPGVANVHLDATEHRDGIVFMHAVKPGPANRSYGLAVAKLAGVPREVIGEARKYLAALESQAARSGLAGPQTELAFETPDDGVAKDILKRLSETDLDALSPREAQQLLYELRELSTRA